MIQKSNVINHIALVLDASGSMAHLKSSVIRVADEQIKNFAKESQQRDQETRVSVYTFSYSHKIECLIFDKDVLRLPSIADLYYTSGRKPFLAHEACRGGHVQHAPSTG